MVPRNNVLAETGDHAQLVLLSVPALPALPNVPAVPRNNVHPIMAMDRHSVPAAMVLSNRVPAAMAITLTQAAHAHFQAIAMVEHL